MALIEMILKLCGQRPYIHFDNFNYSQTPHWLKCNKRNVTCVKQFMLTCSN